MKEKGLKLKKFLGQHFLIDKNILKKVIETARIKEEERVLEIGAGIGTLTLPLAKKGAYVVAVEKDKELASLLVELASSVNNKIKVLNEDFLRLNLKEVLSSYPVWKVVSNPPYHITAPLLFKLIHLKEKFSSIILMLQRELVNRIIASPGSKDYSFLTIKVQYHMEVETVHKVSRRVFFPPPRVDSTLLILKPLKKPKVKVSNEELFFKISDAIFRMRRKTLKNSLAPLHLPPSFFENPPLNLQRRGETLSLKEIGILTDFIERKNIKSNKINP